MGIEANPSAIGLSEGGRFWRSPLCGRGRKIPIPATKINKLNKEVIFKYSKLYM
jgi:hypothetical protein